jgi:hypothetical protein
VRATYGEAKWDLPLMEIQYPVEEENYLRWFARFLLEGKIFPLMKKFEVIFEKNL